VALPWASDELRLIRWLGAGVASIALIIIVVSVWTGFGGNTLEIVHGIALVVGALTTVGTGLATTESTDHRVPYVRDGPRPLWPPRSLSTSGVNESAVLVTTMTPMCRSASRGIPRGSNHEW
jgi:hypothetical protein